MQFLLKQAKFYPPSYYNLDMDYLSSVNPTLCARRRLKIISGSFLVKQKNVLFFIKVYRHYTWLNDTPREKSTTVENCSVIVGTKDGSLFLGGSTSGKIYVWEVGFFLLRDLLLSKVYTKKTSTGNLLNVLTAHYSKISCLKFSDDRSFLISCGEDGIVSVWNLSRHKSIKH
jgi:WD40 repeat protein